MKKPILTLADDQVRILKGQILIHKMTKGHIPAPCDSINQGEYELYDVEFIEEIPESEKMKSVVSDEEILAKANDFYQKPRPGYTDLDMNDRGQL